MGTKTLRNNNKALKSNPKFTFKCCFPSFFLPTVHI